MSKGPYILFDGKCHFCIATTGFVLKHDKGRYQVLPVQDALARKILREYDIRVVNLNTIYVIEDGEVLTKSKAAFKIFSNLSYPWKIVSAFGVLPAKLTDWGYSFIAKNRFVFGRSDHRIETFKEKFGDRLITEEEK